MKRLLFIIPNQTTGGTNRSLQSLLVNIDNSKYAVDVFAMSHGGVYDGAFTNCRLLSPDLFVESIIARLENLKGWRKAVGAVAKLLCKISGYRFQEVVFAMAAKKLMRKKYDTVIAYSEGVATGLLEEMAHRSKLAWIHCDYLSYYQLNGCKDERAVYSGCRAIVCVSEFTRQSFLSVYPEFASRTYAIGNLMDVRRIRLLALEPVPEHISKSMFNILSIGRIDPVKRLSVIPEIAAKLMDCGHDFHWYIIGPKGTDAEYSRLLSNMERYGCRDRVTLLGEKKNPYSYIRLADLVVNTSISEACPYVVNEAKILGKPVVCTDFGSAPEFIQNGVTGYYVPLGHMAAHITELISDKRKYTSMCDSLADFKYGNEALLEKIDMLLNAD